MDFIRLFPVMLSMWLLAAHFLHAGRSAVTALCALMPMLLLIRRGWIVRLVQVVLLLGALEWLRTMVVLIEHRQQMDRPWARLAIILAAVMLFTATSGLVFRSASLRQRYFPTVEPRTKASA